MDKETAETILAKVVAARQKQAALEMDPDQAALRAQALRNVLTAGGVGLGMGVGFHGLTGLLGLLHRNAAPPQHPRQHRPAEFELPYPAEKAAEGAEPFPPLYGAQQLSTVPWLGAATTLAGMGGLGLGWHGMGKLLTALREHQGKIELESARSDFRDAMLSQYDRPGERRKAAGDEATLGTDLDQLYDAAEKQAVDMGEWARYLTNYYGLYAAPAAALAGIGAYNITKKRSRRSVLDQALKQRQRERAEGAPSELYAMPVPVAHSESSQHALPRY